MRGSKSTANGYLSATAEMISNALAVLTVLVILVFAGWMASTSGSGVLGGIFLFAVGLLVGGAVGGFLFLGIDNVLKTPEQRSKEKDGAKQAQAHEVKDQRVPILQWRGLACMTRSESVTAYCSLCQYTWRLDGKVANSIAEAQGLANRLIRGGTKLEGFGATFTPGASGRRIAAGLESERHQRALGGILRLALCPSCRRLEGVHLRK